MPVTKFKHREDKSNHQNHHKNCETQFPDEFECNVDGTISISIERIESGYVVTKTFQLRRNSIEIISAALKSRFAVKNTRKWGSM